MHVLLVWRYLDDKSLDDFRTLFTNQHRTFVSLKQSIDINPNILKNIVEVKEEGILVKI